ncbi:PilZ domain-containing protein [Geomesophilobacter sediminis]|uniref:PilZ domain-containing protein n=1 Tax=Geomesophilobacter sediminis TaxID=2798584 RepID=A0A8J7IQC0_9BACT|nr:PilZ domain-containing protein [Geomesophilobacter sediminis]MBJ6726033.1 PilZ domain-containing protein [Geomesophilobacter sediminis]
MNDLYQRIQIKGEEKDSAEIVEILAKMKAGKIPNDLRFLNYFKEIPVSYGADLLTVETDSAEFEVHQVQAVVMSTEKVTVMKSDAFRRDVLANVTYVNIEKSRIVLSRFSYAVVRADRRMSVRVALTDDVIKASFTSRNGEISGTLNDMSLTGVSISVPSVPNFSPSEVGIVTVSLPVGTLTLPATLLKVTDDPEASRVAFQIEPDRDTENLISRFIVQRQVEIIKELKEHPGLHLP